MDFKIEPVTPEDAEELAEVFFHSFSDDFSRRLFPQTDDVRVWWIEKFRDDAVQAQTKGKTSFLKVVGTAEPGQKPVIAAFALWKLPKTTPEPEEEGHVTWPDSSDSELCDQFFGKAEEERKLAVEDQPHYYLDILGTHADFGRRGLGSKLVEWGVTRADEDALMSFISATPQGRGLYEKHGFKVVNLYEVVPGHSQASMVRPVRGIHRG